MQESSLHLVRNQLLITIETKFENKCIISFLQYVVPILHMPLFIRYMAGKTHIFRID
jgi:hypothetical protein